MHGRTWMQSLTLAVVLAAGLAGCAKSEPPKAAAPAAAPAPAAKPEPLKIGFIYVGPVADAGWTFAHDQGRKAVEARFGDKVKTTFIESVKEGPDAERVIRDLVAQGNKLIFATSFGFGDSMEKVAKDHPEVLFEHATGFKTAPNLRNYEGRFYENAYLAGVLAGMVTKSNVIGFVGSFPIPEVLRNINAFTLGARSTNPKVKTKVVWISTWVDPPKEAEAAQSLINQGADVLLQNTDSTAVLQTAEKNGKFAFGWDSDMSAFAPKAHLGSCAIIWAPYYLKAVNDALEKTWKVENTKWGTKEGLTEVVKIPDTVPAAARAKVEEARAFLVANPGAVFRGPIKDSTGKEVLAAGVVGDDKWKGEMGFYVQGVDGKVPAGK